MEPGIDISNTLFVGVKGHVAAIDKLDGSVLWKTQLTGAMSMGHRFVTVLVEGERVYAHCHGELFCLDASTGKQLWNNKLEGLGYDIATLAVEGKAAPSPAAAHGLLSGKPPSAGGG